MHKIYALQYHLLLSALASYTWFLICYKNYDCVSLLAIDKYISCIYCKCEVVNVNIVPSTINAFICRNILVLKKEKLELARVLV